MKDLTPEESITAIAVMVLYKFCYPTAFTIDTPRQVADAILARRAERELLLGSTPEEGRAAEEAKQTYDDLLRRINVVEVHRHCGQERQGPDDAKQQHGGGNGVASLTGFEGVYGFFKERREWLQRVQKRGEVRLVRRCWSGVRGNLGRALLAHGRFLSAVGASMVGDRS